MHVFAHQAVAHHGVGKGRIARRGEGSGADDGRAVFHLARDTGRLTAPGMVARLEGAGQKVQQADFRFGDHIRIEAAEIDGERSSIKTKHPLLSDPAVRKALALLVDGEAIQKHIYGRAGRTTSFISVP